MLRQTCAALVWEASGVFNAAGRQYHMHVFTQNIDHVGKLSETFYICLASGKMSPQSRHGLCLQQLQHVVHTLHVPQDALHITSFYTEPQ